VTKLEVKKEGSERNKFDFLGVDETVGLMCRLTARVELTCKVILRHGSCACNKGRTTFPNRSYKAGDYNITSSVP
jgi:hypothetical protein